MLYHWKKQYSRGNPVSSTGEPTEEAALKDRIEKPERLVGRLTLENEFLKRVAEQPQPVSEKREIIIRWKHLISTIQRGCRLMNIARSTFYRKRKAKSPDQMETEADLRDRIEAICLEFPRYGYRRVSLAELFAFDETGPPGPAAGSAAPYLRGACP